MARVYQALEIQKDGKGVGLWHFTVSSDEEGFAYCICGDNCPGHKTPQEALMHYKQHILSKELLQRVDTETLKKCQVCGSFTGNHTMVKSPFNQEFILCDAHNTLEVVSKLYMENDRL
jgi:hypothetical protein